ncbi:MAG: copper transporter [Solirubrobacterales bacterium]
MFTPRYHAISLVAVFLALGIGVLLGVALGEEGIVSGASRDLEKSLRGDLDNVRSRNADLRRELAQRRTYEREVYPALVGDLLPEWGVGVVAMGKLPGGYIAAVEDAIEPAGAQVENVSVIESPLPLGRIAGELEDTRLRRVDRDNDDLERLGRRIGRQLGQGGELVQRLRQELFSTSRGDYRGVDGIVFVRDRDGLKGDEKSAQDAFEDGLLEGMRDTEAQVVGVEMMETDPSQVPFMSSHDVASVDDLDFPEGKTALVWAMLGEDGRYGRKATAERLLPPPPERAATRR